MCSINVLFIVCEIFTFVWLVSATNSTVKPYPQNCLDFNKADFSGHRTLCIAQGNTPELKRKDCVKQKCCWSLVPNSKTESQCYRQPSDEVKCEPTDVTSSSYPKNCLDIAKADSVVQRTPCTVEGNTPELQRRDCMRRKGCWAPVSSSTNEFQCFQQPLAKKA